MTRPNIPTRLSFDSRGINDASADYCPRLFSITPGRTNDPQTQALGHAFAAVPALLELAEACQRDADQLSESELRTMIHHLSRSALIAAGYQS